MATTAYGWDCITAAIPMPIAGGTTATQGFSVPKGTIAITFIMPAMAGTGATCALQSLTPLPGNLATEVWTACSSWNPADGSFVVVDGILESTATTIPVTMTGGGVLRLVASETQASAASTIYVVFHLGG